MEKAYGINIYKKFEKFMTCQARTTVLLAKGEAKVSKTVKKLNTSKSTFEEEAKKLIKIICKNDFEVYLGKSRG